MKIKTIEMNSVTEYEFIRESYEKKLVKILRKLDKEKDKIEYEYNMILKELDNTAYENGWL